MNNKTHYIGIGGIGMSALAGIMLERGLQVSGSDIIKSPITDTLEKLGADIYIGHHKDNLAADVTEVVISSAIDTENQEVQEALKRELRIIKRAEKMAELMKGQDVICVAGAHGKTTTTGMLYTVINQAGLDPSVIVGGVLPEIGSNYKIGGGAYFIAEADESDQSFLLFSPYASIITNIEDDHLENYGSVEKIIDAFSLFMAGNQNKKLLTLCIDNENVRNLYKNFPEAITYSLQNEQADYYTRNIGYEGIGICGDLMKGQEYIGRLNLQIPGYHNLQNAVGVCALAMESGIQFDTICQAFSHFYGVNRRFQILYKDSQTYIVDDYAHHPSEIKATLKAARETGIGEVTVIFQPHRYSRTYQLLDSFAESFGDADKIILLPVYSAGEKENFNIKTEDIYMKMPQDVKDKTILAENFEAVLELLTNESDQKELMITMGAGNVYQIAESLADLMAGKKS